MIPYQYIWLIMLLPMFSFIINGIVLRIFFKPKAKIYGYVTITAIGVAAIFSVWALISLLTGDSHEIDVPDISWAIIENVSPAIFSRGDYLSVFIRTELTNSCNC